MNLSRQIKKYREHTSLSQEDLAEKIYVSRQTISNWENEKSYPDVHNLLLLSVLFDVSLDELVKGDVEIMKNEVEKNKFSFWSSCMSISMVLMPLSIAPVIRFLYPGGLIIPLVLCIIMFIAAIKVEKLKKKNNIQTYSEILAYMENKEVDPQKAAHEQKHKTRNMIFMMAGCAAITFLLALIGIILFL